MLVEVVIIPLQDSEGNPVSFAVAKATVLLGFAVVPVLVGAGGVGYLFVRQLRRGELFDNDWLWIPAGVSFYTLQVYVDLDYYPDLFPIVVFSALGVGLLVSTVDVETKTIASLALAVIVVSNASLALGLGPFVGYSPVSAIDRAGETSVVNQPPDRTIPAEYGPYYNETNGEYMNRLYWNRLVPEYCHYRFAGAESEWLQRTDRTYRDQCGVPPDGSFLADWSQSGE